MLFSKLRYENIYSEKRLHFHMNFKYKKMTKGHSYANQSVKQKMVEVGETTLLLLDHYQ